MDAVIRKATLRDVPALQAHLKATWHDTYDPIYGRERVSEITNRWHSLAALEREQNNPDITVLVATVDERLVGTASARLDSDNALHLLRLYVEPERQRDGLGGALLESILEAFPGAARITLEVEPANRKACGFYERHGFRVTGASDDCGGMGDGIPSQIMERRLP